MLARSKQQSILGIIFWLAVSFVAAALDGVASAQAESFYIQLAQPAWAPPSSVFGPVWAFLYALMGLVLWLLIVATLISFWRARRLAGAVLAPYLLWVSFATVLNYSVWQLNPHVLG